MRPDLVAETDPIGLVSANGRVCKMLVQPEDSHRRKYKLALSVIFLLATITNFSLDLAFQVRLP